MPSWPTSVDAACRRCSRVSPPSFSRSMPLIDVRLRKFPDESKNCRPSFFASSAACFVGFAICVSAVFSDVPASDPDLKPFAASVSSAAVVSSKFRPAAFAAAPPCARP